MSTTKRSNRTRTAASAAAVALMASAGIALTAPSALADTVSVGYTCTGPGAPGGVNTLQLTVTAPASVPQGATADLAVSATTQLTAPIDLPANTVSAELDLQLGGAGSGSVTASGATNPDAVPSGSTVSVSGGAASVQLTNAGSTTFTPGNIAVHVYGVTVSCTISGTAPVAATTEVTAA